MASYLAHLSPHEETTLRRIAQGMLETTDVREDHAKRLLALGLIQQIDDLLVPTSKGLERLRIENQPESGRPERDSIKPRSHL